MTNPTGDEVVDTDLGFMEQLAKGLALLRYIPIGILFLWLAVVLGFCWMISADEENESESEGDAEATDKSFPPALTLA